MKKLVLFLAILVLVLTLFSQEAVQTNSNNRVQVPVRVFNNNTFVDNLTIQDFTLYEEGVPQNIDALYLVKENQIERMETKSQYIPPLWRNYFLFFQMIEYNPKLAEAIDYFFNNIMLPQDTLIIVTPLNSYRLTRKGFLSKPKDLLSKEMQKIVRKDVKKGESEYRNMMRDLKRLVRSISSSAGFGAKSNVSQGFSSDATTSNFSLEFLLPRYRDTLQKVEKLRFTHSEVLIQLSKKLESQKGRNQIYFFYQREYRPEISPSILNQMMTLVQDQPHIQGSLSDLFSFYHREPSLKTDKLINAFADSGLLFNFIFMEKRPQDISGVQMNEQSEDIYHTLSKAAQITGGFINTSRNPHFGFKNVLNKSQNYYLLLYSSQVPEKADEFRNIEVEVKNKKFKITHRKGYVKE
ncbi:VWA domain-containing protein [bacterium]|nr:VWA domain-containing protein [bacterium]